MCIGITWQLLKAVKTTVYHNKFITKEVEIWKKLSFIDELIKKGVIKIVEKLNDEDEVGMLDLNSPGMSSMHTHINNT